MGKGSSKGHTPREAKDNLKSTQLLSVIDAISEGPIEGPVDGLKSVLLNSTPVLDSDGNTNIAGVTVVFRAGEQEQTPPEGFESSGSETVPEQEVISRWRIEQCSELSAVSASFVLATPTETDGAVFPGRIMLANTCTWTYRGDECSYHGPAVADEYDQPTSDITKDKCSKCLSGCKFRNNVGNFGGFLSINKLSQ
ncbi:phage minor tail protein L [Shigella sonnei]|nr:phage minor tail protein L [Shigella sonnei]